MKRAEAAGALVRLARLEFERHAAGLADVDARLRAAQNRLHDLGETLASPSPEASAASLAATARWHAWRRDQRMTLLRSIAALRAEREGVATAAQRAFGRWQVLMRATERSARRG